MPRVVPQSPARGLTALTIAAGIVLGVACAFIDRSLGGLLTSPRWQPFTEFGGVFLPAILSIAFITRVTARKRSVVWSTWVFMFTLHMARICTGAFMDPADYGARIFSKTFVGFLVASISIAIVASLIAWLVSWLLEKTHLAVIEQTGTLCWGCGYEMGMLAQCPECGNARREDRVPLIHRGFRALCSRPRVVLATALLPIGFAVFLVFNIYTRPTLRFIRAFPQGERMAGILGDGNWSRIGPGVWVPFEEGSNTGLSIAYWPHDKDSTLVATVYTRTATRRSTSFAPVWAYIRCSFNAQEAAYVLKNGLPRGLIDKMREFAEDANSGSPQIVSYKLRAQDHLPQGWRKQQALPEN